MKNKPNLPMKIVREEPLIAKFPFEVVQKRVYTVRQKKNKLVCNCLGFVNHKTCCHVKKAEPYLKKLDI